MPSLNSSIQQTVIGSNNIFSATGDVYVVQQPASIPQAEAQTRKELLILLHKVKTFWIEGVLDKSIHNAVLLDLGKQVHGGAVDHPWESVLDIPDSASHTLPSGTSIAKVFDQSNRALLILGEPGSGKTMTMLELARDLINRVENDNDLTQPIPVVFNLSSWGDQRLPLSEWIVNELSTKYQIPKRIGLPWLKDARLLPLLDGLDEVKSEGRASCVQAINDFGKDYGLPGLVVCCRLEDYTCLPVRLKLNAAITIQSLTPEQVDEYLVAAGSKMNGLRAALQQDDLLQALAQSPLMLSILTLAHQGIPELTVNASRSDSIAERRRQIFEIYVSSMLKRKGKNKFYSPEQTVRWLSWLARKMIQHAHTNFLIEQLQPSWLSTSAQSSIYVFGSRLIIGLLVGLILGAWVFQSGFGYYFLRFGILSGLMGGFTVGLITLLRFAWSRREGNYNMVQKFSFRQSLLDILIIGLPVGLILWKTSIPIFDHDSMALFNTHETLSALIGGLVGGMFYALIFGLPGIGKNRYADIQPVEAFKWSWSSSLKGGAIGIFALIFTFCLSLRILFSGPESEGQQDIPGFFDFLNLFIISLPLLGWLVGGLRGKRVETSNVANQGIRQSARNAVFAGLAWGLTGMLFSLLPIGFTLSLILQRKVALQRKVESDYEILRLRRRDGRWSSRARVRLRCER